jgi:hypothetical protein
MTDSKIPPDRMTYDEWVKTKKYAVVKTVQTFVHTYVVPIDQLDTADPVENLKSLVSQEQIEEFSQKHVGETIVDGYVINEEKMLEMFDRENEYLANWDKNKKVSWTRNLINIHQDNTHDQ